MFPILRALNADLVSRLFIISRALTTEAAVSNHTPDELLLTLATPDEIIYNKHVVKQVDVPMKSSHVGICAKHVPIIGRLIPGKLRVVHQQGKVEEFEVSEGTMSMNPDGTLQVLPASVIRDGEEGDRRTGTIQLQKWEGGKPTKKKIGQ
uniref:ATP synthase F1 complex delta/epsilon subunit N-terminal domain-containing protein n=1 Tax=Acrobeloides nanus TaxID=290746 RepID=A0A914D662_9BILA